MSAEADDLSVTALRMGRVSPPQDSSSETLPSVSAGNSQVTRSESSLARVQESNSAIVNPVLGSIASVRGEIDDALADMKLFRDGEPDEVLRAISGHAARLVEIVVQIMRIEAGMRNWRLVREEAERVITELKNQCFIASRGLSQRDLDFRMSGGQP